MKNKDIIFFEFESWFDLTIQRPQQIASRLAKENRVIYIEGPGTLLQWLLGSKNKKHFGRFFSNIFFEHDKTKNLFIYRPPLRWYPFERIPLIAKIYFHLCIIPFLRKKIAILEMKKPVLWLSEPMGIILTNNIPHSGIVTDWAFSWLDRAVMKIKKNIFFKPIFFLNVKMKKYWADKILKESDIVFTSAMRYYDEARKLNENTYLFYPGADFNDFVVPEQSVKNKRDKKPGLAILALCSTFSSAFIDVASIEIVAKTHPEWKMILIGGIDKNMEWLKIYENIEFVGYVPHKDLGRFFEKADIFVIPYKDTTQTQSGIPTKLPEFLVYGKPVVCTYLTELERAADFRDVIYLTKTPMEFLAAIENARREDNTEKRMKRIEIAKQYDWDIIVEKMADLVEDRLFKNNEI